MIQIASELTILAVDDTPTNIDVVKAVLSDSYFVQAAINGQMALKIIEKKKPDLILLDIMMPEMDGYEVCRRLKADESTRDIPIIFLTAKAEVEDETKGLELGAVDYITKPISPPILKERVKTHLELKTARDYLKRQNEILEEKVIERTHQMEELQDVVMVAMGSLAEARDNETGNHIRRTQRYVKRLAIELKDNPRFSEFLTPENITWLYKSAPLHDIGKVGVPDHILLKPGKLTDEEFDEMKKHTTYGRDAIAAADKRVFDLVMRFGTSKSPKRTRSSTAYLCPGRPASVALRYAPSFRIPRQLPQMARRDYRMPTLFPLRVLRTLRVNSAA
ncbi:MAG: response regulator [Sedimenticola sp.]